MKKLTFQDGSVVESEIGWTGQTWSVPKGVVSIEFEDGTILEKPDFVESEK